MRRGVKPANSMNASHLSGAKTSTLALFCARLVAFGLSPCVGAEASAGVQMTNQLDLPKVVADLREQWAAGKIDMVVIAHVHSDRIFALEYDTTRLDNEAYFRLAVLHPDSNEITRKLMAEVEKVTGRPSMGECFVRWGFTFLDRRGARAFSIYTDRSGRRGVVNGQIVQLDSDDLFKWAERTFKDVFR